MYSLHKEIQNTNTEENTKKATHHTKLFADIHNRNLHLLYFMTNIKVTNMKKTQQGNLLNLRIKKDWCTNVITNMYKCRKLKIAGFFCPTEFLWRRKLILLFSFQQRNTRLCWISRCFVERINPIFYQNLTKPSNFKL